MGPDLPTPEYLRMEYFPAHIDGIDTPSGDIKVVTTDSHMHVVADSDIGPCVTATYVLESYEKQRSKYLIEVVDPDTQETIPVQITRAPSCGCGSRLRSFKLFPGVRKKTTT